MPCDDRLSDATDGEDNYDDDDYNYDDEYDYIDNSQNEKDEDYDVTTEKSELPEVITDPVPTTVQVEVPIKATGNEESKTESIQAVQSVFIEETETSQIENCPKLCTCDEQFQFIDCSNRSLTEIPKNLPNTSLQINLSFNDIHEIHESDLSNLTVVRKILLANNEIEYIDRNVFQTLHRLDHLDLESNNLSSIDPDLFIYAQGLSELILSNNPITFEVNKTFLNLPNLEILNLVGCNISEFYNETFMNLTTLSSLNLANNSINEDLNVNAFTPLTSLLKLKIPHVSRTATYGLCEQISVIDVISFDNYNISCYELISGSTFDESTITHGPTVHVENVTVPMQPSTTTPATTTTTEKVIVNEDIEPSSTTSSKTNSRDVEINPKVGQIEPVLSGDGLNATNSDNVQSESVEKADSIRMILIASIGVAVLGLIIGLIFRKDLFGVKTKLCRSPRPEQPTIPEQVPLNKV
ncbi:Slit like 1 protein [Pseudolycoriella hygida]|uniref:Slit like 1 protein n=1 Tax=Pseudolycoriella hygida TaxID=35572 RepID=A0A9Q0NAS9_9DIPT|nr:Slit like 1 protein [Pseudolycoriella hygida]